MKKGLLIFAIALGACTTDSEPKVEENIHHHDETTEIVLDNGEKWVVDAEMMAHIKNIDTDVALFEGEDYASLHEKLDDHLTLLTSNCTMTGQAHDELHKWLVPFLGTVEELGEAETLSESESVYDEIKSAMAEFNTYFI